MQNKLFPAAFLAALYPAVASADCPAGFLPVIALDETQGCIQESEVTEPPGGTRRDAVFPNYQDAVMLCRSQYGGRLPTLQEALYAAKTTALIDLQDDEPEWLAEPLESGSLEPTCQSTCGRVATFTFGAPGGGATVRSTNASSTGSANVRCWIPARRVQLLASAPAFPPWAVLALVALMLGGAVRIARGRRGT